MEQGSRGEKGRGGKMVKERGINDREGVWGEKEEGKRNGEKGETLSPISIPDLGE